VISWYFELHLSAFEDAHTIVLGIFKNQTTEISFKNQPSCRSIDRNRRIEEC